MESILYHGEYQTDASLFLPHYFTSPFKMAHKMNIPFCATLIYKSKPTQQEQFPLNYGSSRTSHFFKNTEVCLSIQK